MNILYKYRPINKNTISSLINSEFHYSFAEQFNDPFDCDFYYYNKGTRKDKVSYLLKRLPMSSKKFIEMFKELNSINFNNRKVKDKYPSLISGEKSNDKSLIVNCFTKKPNNILMWSHYADNHKGICIGYNYKKNGEKLFFEMGENMLIGLKSSIAPLYKVRYDIKYPLPYNFFKEEPNDLMRFFKVKYKEWEYEKEYRSVLIYSTILKQIIKYNKEILSKIIFGIKTSDSDIKLIKNIISENYIKQGIGVKFFKADKIKGKYKLNIIPIKL